MCSCHSIPECCVTFSVVKLSMGSLVLFLKVYKVQILLRSLHIINFLYPFSNKNAKYE